jgi:hypothetical protein
MHEKHSLSFLAVVAVLALFSSQVRALPRFALRGGDINCRGCHVDPTGGRIRTAGGDNFAMNRLAMWPSKEKFSANIGEGIRIGVDMRSQYLYFSDYQTFPSNYAALGHTRPDTTLRANGALEMSLPIYVSAQLSEAVQAYLKIDPIASNITSNSWEGYATVHFVHSSGEFIESGSAVGDAYIKAGAFFPAFGTRFDDHTIYTRGGNADLSGFGPAGLFWQPNYKDMGFELGIELFDHAFITADILNGNESYQGSIFKADPLGPYAISLRGVVNTGPMLDKQFSAEVGGSLYVHTNEHFAITKGVAGRGDSIARTWVSAIHGGIHYGSLSVLAEWDMGNFVYQFLRGGYADTVHTMAVEAAVDLTKGLTGVVRFDNFYSGNVDHAATNIRTRFMFGMQWFPVRFLEFRPEFRVARGTAPAPQDPTKLEDHTETTAILQTHIFF